MLHTSTLTLFVRPATSSSLHLHQHLPHSFGRFCCLEFAPFPTIAQVQTGLSLPPGHCRQSLITMTKGSEMTEISLMPLEDNLSGHSSFDRSSRTDLPATYVNSPNNRASNFSYPHNRPPVQPDYYHQQQRYSYVDDTPGASPPGTPLTGGGGAMPYGHLAPPRYPSNGIDSRSSSPFPQSTPYVSAS